MPLFMSSGIELGRLNATGSPPQSHGVENERALKSRDTPPRTDGELKELKQLKLHSVCKSLKSRERVVPEAATAWGLGGQPTSEPSILTLEHHGQSAMSSLSPREVVHHGSRRRKTEQPRKALQALDRCG